MGVVVQRLVDRDLQSPVQDLETEYFTWVNGQLEAEFGIRLDVEAMIARDLAELEIYLPPGGALFLAIDDADLVGMIFLTPIRGDTAQIRRMYVPESHRRKGVGGTLFAAAVQAARGIGYARVLLESPRSWAGAHAVYQAHGFRTVAAYPESEAVPNRTPALLDASARAREDCEQPRRPGAAPCASPRSSPTCT